MLDRFQTRGWVLAIAFLSGAVLRESTASGAVLRESTASAAQIDVPADYPTIQAAINAANPGDVIAISAGQYNEGLTINKSLTLIGSGTNNCIVYYTNTSAVVSIAGPGTVELAEFEIIGGQYVPCCHYYAGTTPQGIVATNVNLILNDMLINQVRNYFVTVAAGSITATNVSLFTRAILQQCDVGFELLATTGTIYNLCQDAGQIDHTINVDTAPGGSSLTIDHCRIHASELSYGNCVRTYIASHVTITNCLFYRHPDVTNYPGGLHNGVGVNGYSNDVMITGNTFSNLPWAIYCYGSPGIGGDRVIAQNNAIFNSSGGGVLVDGMQYQGLDLGGGLWGGQGNNRFSQTTPNLTNYAADVFMSTNTFSISTTNLFALYNVWSNPTNRESVIYDKLDNPIVGRVITTDLAIKSVGADAGSHAVLQWNERGAGEHYTVQFTQDLLTGVWTNAPGLWPISNPSLQADMCWTNSTTSSGNIFYRVHSQVP